MGDRTRSTSVRPVGDPRGDKRGSCRLCGAEGGLTRTHVPPEASGNDGKARSAVTRTEPGGVPMLDHGRESDGGMWGYWFCQPCNGATGVWDEHWLKWQAALLGSVQRRPQATDNVLHAGLNAKPGAFVRSMWAWMFALLPGLLDEHPAVAEAVRTGEPVDPPPGLRLLFTVTRSLNIYVSSQRDVVAVDASLTDAWSQRPSGLVVQGPSTTALPLVVVGAPPFNVVLVADGYQDRVIHFDASAWLLDAAGDIRDVQVQLPMIAVRNETSPLPTTFDDFSASL